MSDFSKKINQIFADAYHAAALKEADIQALADVLEPMRSDLKQNGDTLATRKALDTAVGGNRDPRAAETLVGLREQFIAWQKEFWVNELETVLEKSPEEAWQFFLHRYVECLSVWRTQLAHWWAATALGSTAENKKIGFPEKKQELLRVKTNAHLMEQRRWPEAYPFVRELGANQVLSPKLRAQCWTTCASIQIYFNTIPDARHDLAEAEKLFPELHFLQLTRADLERIVGNYEASRQILQKLLEKNPADTEALNGMARTFSEEKNFAEAERLLETAISTDPGNSTNYRDKIGLWAKDEAIFSKSGEKIPELVTLANLADPESQVSNLLEAGYAYQTVNNLGEAKKWFEKAQKIEPERPEIFVALGYLYPAMNEHEQAVACFEKAIELSPASVDGYWGLAALRSGQEKYLEAAEWYEKALPHCPMFARTLLVKAGEMYMAANDLDKASTSCLKALEMDPGFDFALNTLHDITDQLRNKGYDENTGMDAALGVLQKIRAIKGEAYEASFHNNAGNVYFYFSDYPRSAEHYRLAIASGGNDAVYYDNLAGALEKLMDAQLSFADVEEMEAALSAAKKAAELNPANEAYKEKTKRIAHKIKTLRHFGVVAEERSASIVPVRVRFRHELQEWLVKGNNLDPDLLHKIEAMREQFRKTYGFAIPGVRFSADWNITLDANVVIDLDGIPAQQGLLNFEKGKEQEPIDTLVSWLEQLIHFNLADFIHYDSPEISAKFAGKSAFHAASFFQVVRVLLKQKIPIGNIDTIHELFEAERAKNPKITIQELAQSIRCHPSILPGLPVNTAASRDLIHLRPDQEANILKEAGKSHCGEQFMQIRQSDPVFQEIVGDYWPKMDYYPGGHAEFVVSRNPKVATLLNDLRPGYYFSQSEILNLTETEKSAMPT